MSRATFHGRHYQVHDTSPVPAPRQKPRLPITIGGQSPTALQVAVERGDCWNTHGPFGHSYEQILDITRKQNQWLDHSCAAAGRDPRSLRRSLLLFDVLGPPVGWTFDFHNPTDIRTTAFVYFICVPDATAG